MVDRICEITDYVKKQKPLIHCITNPISINQCANTILAAGAKPVMAEHPGEVCEITESADSLMLNLGNITDARMNSMRISANKANEKEIPVILDAVGIACSGLRRQYIKDILSKASMTVIKGNYSEICALHNEQYFFAGVDAEDALNRENVKETAVNLAKKYNAVILATGKTDVITDGENTIYVNNGCRELTYVTGTGCMLGSLCASFLAVSEPMDAIVSACVYFGICGQLAVTDKGTATFMVNLTDKLSTLIRDEISELLDIEENII